MFYEPRLGHGLPHDPFKAIVAPRPIGWISTVDVAGRPNLAPYSFFNAVHSRPPMLAFTSETMKHSAAYAVATGEFVFNLCARPLFEAMNASSGALAGGESEFEAAGLATAPCRVARAPRVAASPAALECRVVHSMRFNDVNGNALDGWMIVGQVVGVHIDDAYLRGGRFDTAAARPVARCGYRDYSDTLCSQPTISRTENRPGTRSLPRMARAMAELYCGSFRQVPRRIVLDVDDTFDAAHGERQLRLFNAHYDEYGFQPIAVSDGEGRPVTAMLRPAKRPSGRAGGRRALSSAAWRAPSAASGRGSRS